MDVMTIVNYIIEANVALVLILALYLLFLGSETHFRLSRCFLLSGIFAAIIFPLIHIEFAQSESPLSISQMIPSYWLPEVVIGGGIENDSQPASFNFWTYATGIYIAGFILCSIIMFAQLAQLFRIIRHAKTYRVAKLRIAESTENKPIFSFFRFIFIGNADQLSTGDKQQIIRHESVHAQQWHSFDILLINALSIFFWFNPLIYTYKKAFIQLHEFEADARAVENADVSTYCSLLAKVALRTVNFPLANHFNNSLTVKRIEMIRTLKTSMKRWKLVALTMTLPMVFFFIACQDQVGDDIMNITKNSSHALIVPEQIQARFDKLKKANPDKDYVLLELNEAAAQNLEKLKSEFGLPASIEVFKTVDGKVSLGASGRNIPLPEVEHSSEEEQTFAILEFNDQASKLSDEAAGEDRIYTVVQHQPEYPGGYDPMMNFIKENLQYPSSARQQGVEGTVYVSFIVEPDGAISDTKIIRGLSPEVDNEARRVVESFPNWIPGKQNGEAVKVRFVLPIKFSPGKPALK